MLCTLVIMIIPLCRSVDDPPQVPVFTGGREKRPSQVQVLTSEMTRAIGGANTSKPHLTSIPTGSAGISPGKVTNLRSNYLQQMRDLHSLFESGAITESEFQEQSHLEQLKKLSSC